MYLRTQVKKLIASKILKSWTTTPHVQESICINTDFQNIDYHSN